MLNFNSVSYKNKYSIKPILELAFSLGIEKRKFLGQEILVPGQTGQKKEIFEKFFVSTALKKIDSFSWIISCFS